MTDLTLADVCSVITDGAHNSPKSVESGGLPMASVKDMTPFGINLTSCRRIATDDFHMLVRQGCKPLPGDVLIAKDGATALDTVCVMKEAQDFVLLSSVAILRPDPKKIRSHYLRYFLEAPSVRSFMKGGLITGAAIPRVVLKDFKRCPIQVPDLKQQEAVCSILSAYDDLIENNTRRIKILEEMAQMLYREWFVNFRFPGHEKVRMVESELGPIPEGWSVEPLGSLTSVVTKGTTPTTLGRQFQDSGVNFVKVESIAESGAIIVTKLAKIDTDTHELLKRSQLRHNDILFSIAGAIGRVAMVPIRVLPANTNQALAIIRCSDADFITYLLATVRSIHFQNFSLGRVVQTAQANVSLSILKSAPILVPPSKLLTSFKESAEPILALVDVLSSKIENLRTTRDFLLPKLISGEVSIEAAEELMEQTA